MNEQREVERLRRTSVSQHHKVDTAIPDNHQGYTGETRFVQRVDGKYNKIRKYPDGWKEQLGGMDFVVEGNEVKLVVTVGGKRYRLLFGEEV